MEGGQKSTISGRGRREKKLVSCSDLEWVGTEKRTKGEFLRRREKKGKKGVTDKPRGRKNSNRKTKEEGVSVD